MDQIEPYRQIVQLQSEIVKISRRNSDLKRKCTELEAELTEKRVLAPKSKKAIAASRRLLAPPVGLRALVAMLVKAASWFRLARNSGV